MNFTQTQIKEILMNYANSEDGLNNLLQLSVECLLRSERLAHNENYEDVSNGFRPRKIMHNGTILEIQIPRTRLHAFKPVILGVLKNQREEVEKLAFSLYQRLDRGTNWRCLRRIIR